MVQPHSRIEAAICAICASECVRALRALGISAAKGTPLDLVGRPFHCCFLPKRAMALL